MLGALYLDGAGSSAIHRNSILPEFNRANLTRVRSAMRRIRTVISAGDRPGAEKLLSATYSELDQAIRKGALKENTANRYKSRISLAINTIKA